VLHGFGDPGEVGEARLLFWTLGAEILRSTSHASQTSGILAIDPVRAAAIRAVVGKYLDSQDHTIDTPTERQVLDVLIESASGFAQTALEQLAKFTKILARAESLKLASGSSPAAKSRQET
jgi:hypothetical protein